MHVSSHPFEPFNKETPSWKKKRGRGVVKHGFIPGGYKNAV